MAEPNPNPTAQPVGGRVQQPRKKKYTLLSGTHSIPNPGYVEGTDPQSTAYVQAKEGDTVELTDDQFAAFKHKFRLTDGGTEKITTSQPTA